MRKLAIVLWVGQVLAAVIMLIAALIEIQSIIGTGPALSIIGLALAAVTRRLNSWKSIAFGLSGPLVCALGALLIFIYDWGPPSAERPITILLSAYVVAAMPLAALSLRVILRWHVIVLPQQRLVWQYSMKSLMIWMTAVCVLATVGQFIPGRLAKDSLGGEATIFIAFALSAVALSGAVLWRFLVKRRKQDNDG